MATVKINGKEITVEDGTLILEAARQAGFDIPTMCYYPGLSRLASCRVCLVEIVGQKKLQPSCATPVLHGMEVLTESPVVKSARSAMIELLLQNHPLDCPVCDKGGECELQDITFKFGPRHSPFSDWKRRFNEEDYILSPVIVQNANRCIECKRCVRICEEVVGVGVLGSIDRGAETKETSFVKEYLDCDHCGNCIEVCPVGSLMSRPYRYKARPWDLQGVDTVCTYCGTGCQMTVQSRKDEVVRVISKADKGINNETLCARGRFGYSFIDSHERLVTPMIRRGNYLEPATWEEAIDVVREGLTACLKDGKKIGGIASSRLSNEELYLFQKLMRGVLKSGHIDSGSRWHSGAVKDFSDTMELNKGGLSIYDALNTEVLFIIGSALSDEVPVTDYIIRRMTRNRKMSIIISSPRGIKLDSSATISIRHRPGTEGVIIGGILRCIYERNLERLKDLPEKEQIRNLTKERVSDITASDWACIESTSGLMDSSRTITIAVGTDVLRIHSQLGFLKILIKGLRILGKDVKLFPLFDRANQRGALDMGVHPDILPGYRFIDEGGLGTDGIVDAASRGEIGALYVVGEDILSDYPDGRFVRESLRQVRFIVVQDIFMTETARMAHVVLPGASFVEKEGTFTNQEGRVQRLRKLLEPRGDAKMDWEIIASIGESIDPSFNYSSVYGVFEEIKRAVPMYREISFNNLDGNGVLTKVAGRSEQGTGGQTEVAGRSEQGTGVPLPATCYPLPATSPDPEYPFLLITGNHLYHSGRLSMKADTLREILPEAIVEINEEDARKIGVSKGDKVKVKNKRYEATVTVRINKGSMQGVVFIPENFTDVPVNMFFKKGEGYPRVKLIPLSHKQE